MKGGEQREGRHGHVEGALLDARAALDLILREMRPLGIDRRGLEEARGCVLAEEVRAPHPLPPFESSAMDGFALTSGSTRGSTEVRPARLRLVGESRAGHPFPGRLGSLEAVRIMTGAPLPEGADAVEVLEVVREEAGEVVIPREVAPGANVRLAGEDVAFGQVALRARTVLKAGPLSLLASLGIAEVSVYRPPTVALLATGSELAPPGARLGPGMIHESNTRFLQARLAPFPVPVRALGVARDEEGELREKIGRALEADLAVLSGGVSVGAYDLVRPILEELGAKPLFWRVNIKPGKPLLFARGSVGWVFGLPGNPLSTAVCFHEFVAPALRALLGHPLPRPRALGATLGAPFEKHDGKAHFALARLAAAGGRFVATPLHHQHSHRLAPLAEAQALIVVPSEVRRLEAGSAVEVHPLEFDEAMPGEEDAPGPVGMKVLGIVGPSGSGKTTLAERLIPLLEGAGLRVGAIKHAPQGFEMDREGKDSWRLAQAGARAVVVASPDRVALLARTPGEWGETDLIALLPGPLDLVLIEGFHAGPHARIEVRGPAGERRVEEDRGRGPVLAVIGREGGGVGGPVYGWDALESLAERIVAWMRE